MQRIMYFMSLICLYMSSLASNDITANTLEVSPKRCCPERSECARIRSEEHRADVAWHRRIRREMRGRPGKRGERGEQGARGRTGDQGKPGKIGARGCRGVRGERGKPGKRGRTGTEGEHGNKGELGPRGLSGISGERGPRGDTGKNGPDGHRGNRGARGDRGHKGLFGQRGRQGHTTNISLPAFISGLIEGTVSEVVRGDTIGSTGNFPPTPYNVLSSSNITVTNGVFTSSAGPGYYKVDFGLKGFSAFNNQPGQVQLYVDGSPLNSNGDGLLLFNVNSEPVDSDWANDSVIVYSASATPTFSLQVLLDVILGGGSTVADMVFMTIVKLR